MPLEPPSARSGASVFATKRERRRKLAGRSPSLPERREKPEYDGVESHTSSCRNNLQKPVAPRSRGSFVPSPSCTGVFGCPSVFCTDATHAVSRVLLYCSSWAALAPCIPFVPPPPGGRRPLTHSPRKEVVSGPTTRGVPTPRLLGSSLEWQLGRVLFGLPARGPSRPLHRMVGTLSQRGTPR